MTNNDCPKTIFWILINIQSLLKQTPEQGGGGDLSGGMLKHGKDLVCIGYHHGFWYEIASRFIAVNQMSILFPI